MRRLSPEGAPGALPRWGSPGPGEQQRSSWSALLPAGGERWSGGDKPVGAAGESPYESGTGGEPGAASLRERVHVYFSGRVQGVGFRYTARALAGRFAVVGFVRNLSDGRVELEAEGPPGDLRGYLEAVQREFRHYIRDREVRWLAPTGVHERFEVRF